MGGIRAVRFFWDLRRLFFILIFLFAACNGMRTGWWNLASAACKISTQSLHDVICGSLTMSFDEVREPVSSYNLDRPFTSRSVHVVMACLPMHQSSPVSTVTPHQSTEMHSRSHPTLPHLSTSKTRGSTITQQANPTAKPLPRDDAKHSRTRTRPHKYPPSQKPTPTSSPSETQTAPTSTIQTAQHQPKQKPSSKHRSSIQTSPLLPTAPRTHTYLLPPSTRRSRPTTQLQRPRPGRILPHNVRERAIPHGTSTSRLFH